MALTVYGVILVFMILTCGQCLNVSRPFIGGHVGHFEIPVKNMDLRLRFEWNEPPPDLGEKDFYQYMDYLESLDQSEGQYRVASHSRQGSPTRSNTCQQVRGVPSNLRSASVMAPSGIVNFYQKYTEAYGIPVLSSSRANDDALRRACYVLRLLLADRDDVRTSFYRLSGRVAVIAEHETTTTIPEHSYLPSYWNTRARGFGATESGPVSTCGEENLLCLGYPRDKWYDSDVFVHELAHGVHILGARHGIAGFDDRLKQAYNQAMSRGLWASTYSAQDYREYFAEGTTIWFNVQGKPSPGIHGNIQTRDQLRTYDPTLYSLVQEIFPCNNAILDRCHTSRQRENSQQIRMDCGGGSSHTSGTQTSGSGCVDNNQYCASWKNSGYCTSNAAYMNINCKKSCGVCSGTSGGSSCVDNNQYCASWQTSGYCTSNAAYMNINCKKSCGICGGGHVFGRRNSRSSCADHHSYCKTWADMGNCHNAYKDYMAFNCKQSCHLCSGAQSVVGK